MENVRLLLKLLEGTDFAFQIVIFLTGASVLVGLLNTWNKYLETRLEREKLHYERENWKNQILLEIEKQLTEHRMRTYPQLLTDMETISSYRLPKINAATMRQTAEKLHKHAYGEAGTYMDADTRKRLMILRDRCEEYARELEKEKPINMEEKRKKLLEIRTDVTERLRRDINLPSMWRPQIEDYISLSEKKTGEQKQGFFNWLFQRRKKQKDKQGENSYNNKSNKNENNRDQ